VAHDADEGVVSTIALVGEEGEAGAISGAPDIVDAVVPAVKEELMGQPSVVEGPA
jgi:hypothetical protein